MCQAPDPGALRCIQVNTTKVYSIHAFHEYSQRKGMKAGTYTTQEQSPCPPLQALFHPFKKWSVKSPPELSHQNPPAKLFFLAYSPFCSTSSGLS